jgi:menaquinone-dependent protoporphyrinogen IX oxidase
MKIIVIYSSKTGFTSKYASWIAEELGCELAELSTLQPSQLEPYEVIIYGGGLYVVGINGLKDLMKQQSLLRNKKLIVFACGATPDREETTLQIRNKNFTNEQQQHIPFFYLRGGFDFSKLGFKDKFLMILLKMKLKMIRHKSPDVKGMLAAYEAPSDFTKKRYIDGIIDWVKQVSE